MGEGWWGVPLDGVSLVAPLVGVVCRSYLEESGRDGWSEWTWRDLLGG